jgi:hypothetical protein
LISLQNNIIIAKGTHRIEWETRMGLILSI